MGANKLRQVTDPAGDLVESDFSIMVRTIAVWLLLTAVLAVATWLVVSQREFWGSLWFAVPVLAIGSYPLGVLAFTAAPNWRDRLYSGLKLSGQSAMLAAFTLWVNPRTVSEAVIVVTLLSLGIAVGLWRAGRVERTEEAAQRNESRDDK